MSTFTHIGSELISVVTLSNPVPAVARPNASHAPRRFEGRVVADLDDEPPSNLGADIRGMTPQRARWARYSAWRVHEQAKLDALEKRKAELRAQIDAPSETETKIQAGVRRTADWMAGRTAEESDAANAKALADMLAEQRPLARAAEQELQELSEKIDVAQLRAKKIAERELDFLRPALIEAAERHGLGKLYAERVDALREVMELLFGLGAEFRGYQDGLPHVVDVELPSAGALGSPPDILSRNAQCGVWRRLADALRRDPRCDASKILPRLA